MTQPTPYARSYNFVALQSSGPGGVFPANLVNIELDAIKETFDEVLANLVLIQRDDGALKNGVVTRDALSDDIDTLLTEFEEAQDAVVVPGITAFATAGFPPDPTLAAPARVASLQELLQGEFAFKKFVNPALYDGSQDVRAGLQSYITAASEIVEEVEFDDQLQFVEMPVEIPGGSWKINGTLNVYGGLNIGGKGMGNTRLVHTGGGVPVLDVVRSADGENPFGLHIHDLAIKGAGKTAGDTTAALRSAITPFGAIRLCALERCLIHNCYDGVNLNESFTFKLADNYIIQHGRNCVRWTNATAGELSGGRLEYAGEVGLYVSDSPADLETINLSIWRTIFQNHQRQGALFEDVDSVNMYSPYFENNNNAGGYPAVEFADGDDGIGSLYNIFGGWWSPAGGMSGQPAIKVNRADVFRAHGIFIRGSGFSQGIRLEANVGRFDLSGIVDGPATKLSAVNAVGTTYWSDEGPRTYGGALINSSVGVTTVGAPKYRQSTVSASTVLTADNADLFFDTSGGNRNATLPPVVEGRRIMVGKSSGDTNLLQLLPDGSDTFEGKTAYYVQEAYGVVHLRGISGGVWVIDSDTMKPMKLTAITANTTIVVRPGWSLDSILIQNTTANAVTGGIRIGTSDGAADVVAAQAVGANALVQITDAAILKRVFSTTANQTLFIQAVTAWNSASLNIHIFVKRAF